MSHDYLYHAKPLSSIDLGDAEGLALAGDTLLHQLSGRLVREVIRLQHDIADPAYHFAGGRIHRHAIVCRNAEIDRLRAEVKALKGAVAGTK